MASNFLISSAVFDGILDAARLGPDETVLEVGAGLGRLTARLAARAGRVVAVEADRRLHAAAAAHLRCVGNVTLLCADFLAGKHRINPLVEQAVREGRRGAERPLKVVSNLPYGIASPAVVNLLEWDVPVGEMCVMVQREVADRLLADAGTRQYGPLTVYVRYWASVERVMAVPRGAFWPAPDVSSAVVRIARRADRVRTDRYPAFASVVRRLFAGRRKQLGTLLRELLGEDGARATLDELGRDPTTRPAQLGVGEFEVIAARAAETRSRPPGSA
jgi:16S rRNA (adenine1518-N6/adenine1519-N6)-dimethyltransferase